MSQFTAWSPDVVQQAPGVATPPPAQPVAWPLGNLIASIVGSSIRVRTTGNADEENGIAYVVFYIQPNSEPWPAPGTEPFADAEALTPDHAPGPYTVFFNELEPGVIYKIRARAWVNGS